MSTFSATSSLSSLPAASSKSRAIVSTLVDAPAPAPPLPTSADSMSDSSSSTKPPTSSTSHVSSVTTRENLTTSPGTPIPVTSTPKATTSRTTSADKTSDRVASTTVSVTVVRGTGLSRTSTITTQADTTLSIPVVLTSTNPDGARVLTTPALVTILSTSTEPNGSLATITHVVANPSKPNSGEQFTTSSGILHNQGAAAGIFVVVGLAVASILVGVIFYIRRRRRINRRRRWLAGMQQQQRPTSFHGDPFRDPSDNNSSGPPMMRSVDNGNDDIRWDRRGGTPFLQESSSGHDHRGFAHGGASVYPDTHPFFKPGPSTAPENHQLQNIGFASPDLATRAQFRRSLAPSTPSIYPASLPAEDDQYHQYHEDEQEPPAAHVMHVIRKAAPVSPIAIPPRPPRSHLRESAKIQNLDYAPLTPPASSVSSHSHTDAIPHMPTMPSKTPKPTPEVRNRSISPP
ncbi:hypothetical protein B0H34DRAFT_47702 [Crassisporium funariophilum]|nr:hypothetical protein B0H34DRAFT_47702 [Crassisporium funariophilum]